MTTETIIASLRDQARNRETLTTGEPDSIFAHDAAALIAAVELIEALTRECLESAGTIGEIETTLTAIEAAASKGIHNSELARQIARAQEIIAEWREAE